MEFTQLWKGIENDGMNVVIIGARERADSEADKKQVEELMVQLRTDHGTRLKIISVGADKGVGKYVRDYCIQNKVIFAEVRIKLEGEDIPRIFFAHMFLSRNMALLEVGDEFYIFCGPNETGIIESIIEPAKKRVGAPRVKVFSTPNPRFTKFRQMEPTGA